MFLSHAAGGGCMGRGGNAKDLLHSHSHLLQGSIDAKNFESVDDRSHEPWPFV